MSNWVENELTVEGPNFEMERFFYKFNKEKGFSFETLLPYPEQFRIEDKVRSLSMSQDEHDWCIEHWGTKWDAQNVCWMQRELAMLIVILCYLPLR